jgi:hypothetical protein
MDCCFLNCFVSAVADKTIVSFCQNLIFFLVDRDCIDQASIIGWTNGLYWILISSFPTIVLFALCCWYTHVVYMPSLLLSFEKRPWQPP